jgi:carboxypeptidase family protein
MLRALKVAVAIAYAVVIPVAAYPQASITGVVKDPSGAVLPGVTVEASSPALIEKVRMVVTDGTGQYRVVDLRPGTYAVTFSLTGFAPVKREGIELTGSFIATVNQTYGARWLTPTLVLPARFAKVSAQFDF